MDFSDYRRHDATGLAGLVARREVSAGELLETAAARMAAVNPAINAVVQDLSDVARRAPPADGPFAGVPFLLKDLGATLAGTTTSRGSRAYAETVADADSALTRLYKAAGLNIFGKTNTPEFGLWPVTESALLGPAAIPGTPAARRGAPPAGRPRRSRRASCRRRTPATAAARSASPPRPAGSSV